MRLGLKWWIVEFTTHRNIFSYLFFRKRHGSGLRLNRTRKAKPCVNPVHKLTRTNPKDCQDCVGYMKVIEDARTEYRVAFALDDEGNIF